MYSLCCKNSYYFSDDCSRRQMYTERISPLISVPHSRLSLPYQRNEICIRGNESGQAGKKQGRTAGRTTQCSRNAASCTGAHRVKMKWPEHINNCTKGTSKIEMGRTRATMHKLNRNGFRGPTAGRRLCRFVLSVGLSPWVLFSTKHFYELR